MGTAQFGGQLKERKQRSWRPFCREPTEQGVCGKGGALRMVAVCWTAVRKG